jgi:transposase
VELFEHIRRDQRVEGLSVHGLAHRHHVHRRTVRQALASALPPARKTPAHVAPRLGAHEATIREWLTADLSAPRKQRHTARRIWQRLVDERGASVAESTVRAYVGGVRRELESGSALVTVPQLHPPGAEAEVDFGAVSVCLGGVQTALAMFVLRLSHSGRAVHVCFPGEGQEAFLEGHTLAFERLGGVPARVRYDNLKAAVVRVLAGRDRTESERFITLRSHFGYDAFFCEPGQGGAHEKGGVEGEVGRFRRQHLVPVPQVASLAELNVRLEAADRADDARHIAGRLVTVGAMAASEQPFLRPLPAERFDPSVLLRAKVDRKARIAVRGSHYSVPASYAGREVAVALGGRMITVTERGQVIARHERSARKGAEILVLDHYLELLARKPGALPGASALAQARASGAFTAAHERFWTRARRRLGDGGGTRALIEVLLLQRQLPFIAIHAALDSIERLGAVDPALVAIEARRMADGRGPTGLVERPALQRFDRPAPSLAGYDVLLAGGAR